MMPILIDPFRGLVETKDEDQRKPKDKMVIVQDWIEALSEKEREEMSERAWKATQQLSNI